MDDADAPGDTPTTEQLAAQVALMAGILGPLSTTVNRLVNAGSQPARKQAAPEFSGDDLVEWVSWLADRYELRSIIPACWPQHGALIEELAAVYVGWLDSLPQAGTAAMQWHEHLARTLERIDSRWRTCTDGNHRARVPTDWLENGPTGANDLDLGRARKA